MTRLVLLMFFLASGLRLSLSQFVGDPQEFQDYRNFSYGYIQTKITTNYSCWIIIYANSFPKLTGENLGIMFGDRNATRFFLQMNSRFLCHGVSVSKLRILRSSLEQGYIDIFQIRGAYLPRICSVMVRRYGEKEDWRPEMVKIQSMKYTTTSFIISFKFSHHPTHTWYGHNSCRSIFQEPPLDPENYRLRNGFILVNHG